MREDSFWHREKQLENSLDTSQTASIPASRRETGAWQTNFDINQRTQISKDVVLISNSYMQIIWKLSHLFGDQQLFCLRHDKSIIH